MAEWAIYGRSRGLSNFKLYILALQNPSTWDIRSEELNLIPESQASLRKDAHFHQKDNQSSQQFQNQMQSEKGMHLVSAH